MYLKKNKTMQAASIIFSLDSKMWASSIQEFVEKEEIRLSLVLSN